MIRPTRLLALSSLLRLASACEPAPSPTLPDAQTPNDAQGPVTPGGDPLPAMGDATVAHVRELVERGRARGNRHEVVAKIGDSISESRAFLFECGDGAFRPGQHADLEPTVRYFTMTALDADGFNSFTRGSMAAVGGWSAADALDGGESNAITQELDAIRPQWAIVMFGTNDLERVDAETYRANLARVLDAVESRDVVPVLSTIPPRRDSAELGARVEPFNDVVRALASTRRVPLMDYWAVLAALPDAGLSSDGVHPSVYNEGNMQTCDVSDAGVRHGYNARNLLAIEMLARLRAL